MSTNMFPSIKHSKKRIYSSFFFVLSRDQVKERDAEVAKLKKLLSQERLGRAKDVDDLEQK